jgi:hypothetical protein
MVSDIGGVEDVMSNASSCRKTAVHFATQATLAATAEERRAYRELERLWSKMAVLAERFDRQYDGDAKAQIYAMIGEVEAVRQKFA